nr:hypothetical protein CFP56_46383 [Quercus suber]
MVQSEGQESVGSRHRDEFVNLEHRRDRALAQSPSIRVKPVNPNHISRSHSVSSRHIPRDQEMHDLRVEDPCLASRPFFSFSRQVRREKTKEGLELEVLAKWESQKGPPPHKTLKEQGGRALEMVHGLMIGYRLLLDLNELSDLLSSKVNKKSSYRGRTFDESFNDHIYLGKLRILGLHHVLRRLEASGYWGISKNDMSSMKLPIGVQEYLRLKDPIEVEGVH